MHFLSFVRDLCIWTKGPRRWTKEAQLQIMGRQKKIEHTVSKINWKYSWTLQELEVYLLQDSLVIGQFELKCWIRTIPHPLPPETLDYLSSILHFQFVFHHLPPSLFNLLIRRYNTMNCNLQHLTSTTDILNYITPYDKMNETHFKINK